MGCTDSKTIQEPKLIPMPKGKAIDPLTAQGDIVEVIISDPHIDYYQKKIQQVIIPLQKQKKLQSQQNKKVEVNQKKESKKAGLKIQKFATSDKSEHKQYVETVNKALQGNDASVTNILAYMLDQMADMRDAKGAQDKFKNDTYAALKCFVYLYTGHYSYKKINSQLRRSEYQKISQVIGIVQKQLEQYNKQKFSRKLRANLKHGKILNLYRGIPKPDKSMQKTQKLFWKGFTSTSLDSIVAKRFGSFTYVISLQSSNPHPYMIVPEDLSQFKEEQIILFPYFYFQCTNVQDFQSGARYQCKQLPPVEQ